MPHYFIYFIHFGWGWEHDGFEERLTDTGHGYRWLYTPRVCAVFFVPFWNQHLIRTSILTGQRYENSSTIPSESFDGKSAFVRLFNFVATYDFRRIFVSPLRWSSGRQFVVPRRRSGATVMILLESEVPVPLKFLGRRRWAMVLWVVGCKNVALRMLLMTVRLPWTFAADGDKESQAVVKGFNARYAGKIGKWMKATAFEKFDIYLQTAFHDKASFVRLSGQIYLEVGDFERVGQTLKILCERIEKGEMS